MRQAIRLGTRIGRDVERRLCFCGFGDLGGATTMHVVTVFSPLPGTGKTTLACELACRLARKGQQVFALDLAPDSALTRRLLGARPHLAPLRGAGSPSPVPSAFTVFDAQRRDETLRIDTSRWPRAAHGVTVLRGDPRIRECSRWFDDAWSRDAALSAPGIGRLCCETWKRESDAIGHTLSMPLRVFHNTFEPRRADAIAVVDLGSESNGFNRAVLAGTDSVIVAVQCNRAAVEYLASAQASIDIMGRCASGPPLGYVVRHEPYTDEEAAATQEIPQAFRRLFDAMSIDEGRPSAEPVAHMGEDPYCLAVLDDPVGCLHLAEQLGVRVSDLSVRDLSLAGADLRFAQYLIALDRGYEQVADSIDREIHRILDDVALWYANREDARS